MYSAISNSGGGQRVSLFSDAGQRDEIGMMTVLSRRDTLRITDIKSCGRSRYKGIGTALADIADRIRESTGLSSLSLISIDDGASIFFYKNGFRFAGEGQDEKNFEMGKHISDPGSSFPDDVMLSGDMERRA
ncbi:hypothetical protein [Bradyrhizobium sp. SSUT77]|uniref:hypothetical protein n=1 Tax=Bradyrhizobium sp. SSUT77 TaxID=3040603 RepID=UPI00244B4532|nr:hypothetical protein [Bradyrhizobium sp. SSUT77]MDH2348574.1 hypothetical protein [Bradyrhizobium sp. SSUT77]